MTTQPAVVKSKAMKVVCYGFRSGCPRQHVLTCYFHLLEAEPLSEIQFPVHFVALLNSNPTDHVSDESVARGSMLNVLVHLKRCSQELDLWRTAC